ncbi:MAG: crotonase/enoyl-CoA hydratase family protein [bacterium]
MIELQIEGAVAWIRLNRPEKRNALGAWFWDEAAAVIARVDAERAVRVAVVAGVGKAFTAGLDLVEMVPKIPIGQGAPDGERQARLHGLIRQMQAAMTCFERCRVPVIAAVHGPCIGAGVDLVTACDIRLAAADAVFSVRETKLAMVADVGTLQRLPRIVGPGAARELVFTGRDFGADEAARIGLVQRVLPDEAALMAAAGALAAEIAANAPLAVQGAKRVMNEAQRADIDRELEYVATWNAAHLVTQDLGVAVTAFVTRQAAEFAGR